MRKLEKVNIFCLSGCVPRDDSDITADRTDDSKRVLGSTNSVSDVEEDSRSNGTEDRDGSDLRLVVDKLKSSLLEIYYLVYDRVVKTSDESEDDVRREEFKEVVVDALGVVESQPIASQERGK